eukprot:gene49230-64876_t
MERLRKVERRLERTRLAAPAAVRREGDRRAAAGLP